MFLLPTKPFPVSRSIKFLHSIANFPTSYSLVTRDPHTSRSFCAKMAETESASSHLTINLPTQLDQPVTIVAAAGVCDSDFRNAIESSLFKQWLKNIQTETGLLANGAMSLKKVLIQSVDMFGSRLGFLKFKADVIDKETGKKVPGIVFARGPAVAVLILLDSDEETYAVLTEQVRVPVGRLILELPAGMLDDDKGDIAGTAIREVEEETGLHLNLSDVIDLTAFLDPSTGCRVFPSPLSGYSKEQENKFLDRFSRFSNLTFSTDGFAIDASIMSSLQKCAAAKCKFKGGCDEDLGLFLYRGRVDKDVIKQLQGKQTGLREHGELIKVHVVPYRTLWRMTSDAKVLMAIALYEMAKRDGFLPPIRN